MSEIYEQEVWVIIFVCAVCVKLTQLILHLCCCTGVTHCMVVCLQVRLSHQTSFAVAVPQLQLQGE